MVLLTLTKINPNSKIAGYSVWIGIAFFFLEEYLFPAKSIESNLRFETIFKDLKKTGYFLVFVLPILSAAITTVLGNWFFGSAFLDHVFSRTENFITFNNLPLLIFQIVFAAWGEEIAYRGFFLGKTMKYYPFWICAVISSAVFSAGHLSFGLAAVVLFDVITIFIDSLIYSIVYRKTQNCMISTLSHIVCNFSALLLAFLFF